METLALGTVSLRVNVTFTDIVYSFDFKRTLYLTYKLKIYIDIYQLCPFLPINNIIIFKTLFVLLAISEIKENMNKNSAFVIL